MAKPKKKEVPSGSGPKNYKTPTDENRIGDAGFISDLLPIRDYASSWSSPKAFAEHIESLDRSKAWHKSGWGDDEDDDDDWSGGSMTDALRLIKEGWREGADRIDSLRRVIQAILPRTPKLSKFSVAGAVPNIPRAIAGNPANMLNLQTGNSKKKPIITLVSNMACNWTVKAHHISNRAAVVAVLIDEIEAKGFACEVISGAYSMGHGKSELHEGKFDACTSVMLKEASQPVDINRMAFGLGHAGMFRRLIFADLGYSKLCEDGLGYGLGHSQGMDKELEELATKGIYLIPSCENGANKFFEDEAMCASKGVKYLIQTLRRQSCPAFPRWTETDQRNYDKAIEDRKNKKGKTWMDPIYDPEDVPDDF